MLDFFRFGLFLNSSATDIVLVTLPSTAVETAIAQCTSRCAMARGHRLNTSIVLAAVHGLSGLFRAVSAVEPFTLSLSSPMSPSLISNLASMDVKQHGQGFYQDAADRASCPLAVKHGCLMSSQRPVQLCHVHTGAKHS